MFKVGDKVWTNEVIKDVIPEDLPVTIIKTGSGISLIESPKRSRLWVSDKKLKKGPRLIDLYELLEKLEYESDGNYDKFIEVAKNCKVVEWRVNAQSK